MFGYDGERYSIERYCFDTHTDLRGWKIMACTSDIEIQNLFHIICKFLQLSFKIFLKLIHSKFS